jgi:hypothetical protein
MTGIEHCPAGAITTISAGQEIASGSAVFTVTVKLQLVLLPDLSVAVSVTVDMPIGNREPEGGELTTETTFELSEIVGSG